MIRLLKAWPEKSSITLPRVGVLPCFFRTPVESVRSHVRLRFATPQCESRIQSLPFQHMIFWPPGALFHPFVSVFLGKIDSGIPMANISSRPCPHPILYILPSSESSQHWPIYNFGATCCQTTRSGGRPSQHSRVKDADQRYRITRDCDGTQGCCDLEGKE